MGGSGSSRGWWWRGGVMGGDGQRRARRLGEPHEIQRSDGVIPTVARRSDLKKQFNRIVNDIIKGNPDLTVQQVAFLVQLTVHWFGPPGFEDQIDAVMTSCGGRRLPRTAVAACLTN